MWALLTRGTVQLREVVVRRTRVAKEADEGEPNELGSFPIDER